MLQEQYEFEKYWSHGQPTQTIQTCIHSPWLHNLNNRILFEVIKY